MLKHSPHRSKNGKNFKPRIMSRAPEDVKTAVNAVELSTEQVGICDKASQSISSKGSVPRDDVPAGLTPLLPWKNFLCKDWMIPLGQHLWVYAYEVISKRFSQQKRKETNSGEREKEQRNDGGSFDSMKWPRDQYKNLSQRRRKKKQEKEAYEPDAPEQGLEEHMHVSDITPYKSAWESQGLDQEAIETLYRVLCLHIKSDHVDLDLHRNDYFVLNPHRIFDVALRDEVFKILWGSPSLQEELERRIRVLYGQFEHYRLKSGALLMEHSLSYDSIKELDSMFQINIDWPTFTNLHKENKPKMELECIEAHGEKNFYLMDRLNLEYSRRKLLISYMSTRKSGTMWWDENELRLARKQGINILILIRIGDLLQFEQPLIWRTSLLDSSKAPQILSDLFGIMEVNDDADINYGIDTGQWAISSAKIWLLKHPILGSLYKSRIKALALVCDKFSFKPGSPSLEILKIFDKKIWWTMGDLLLWSDQGLTSCSERGLKKWDDDNTMLKSLNDLGTRLNLRKSTRISQDNPGGHRLNSLMKNMDSDTRKRIKLYLDTRAQWNTEKQPYTERWVSRFHELKNKLKNGPEGGCDMRTSGTRIRISDWV